MVFILIEVGATLAKSHRGEEVRGLMARYLMVGKDVRKYVSIVSLTGVIVAVGNTVLLLILGVDFALLWGVLSFLFNFVPSLGFLLSLIPPASLALIAFGWQKALIVVVGFFIINAISENVIKTRFMAKGLDVSLLLVIISLLVWTWVLGPVGTIIGVPITLVLYRMYMEFFNQEETNREMSR
jgi:predicted PurR-regulated permease PerM